MKHKRQKPVRKGLPFLIIVTLIVLGTGCASSTVSNKQLSLAPQPRNLSVSVNRDSIQFIVSCKGGLTRGGKEVDSETYSMLAERAVYANLIKFSDHKLGPNPLSDITISKIAVTCEHPVISVGEMVGIGATSFLVVPMAGIKSQLAFPFSVYYEISNRSKKLIYSNKVEMNVNGTYQGWYVNRPIAGKDLMAAQERFVEETAAKIVINELYENYGRWMQASSGD